MTPPTINPERHTLIHPEPLTPAGFAPFGTVIISPLSSSATKHPLPSNSPVPLPLYPDHQPKIVTANQNTALKTSPISPLLNSYPAAHSAEAHGHASHGLMSIFSCFPRLNTYQVEKATTGLQLRLKLGILERHPFTTQTFCPIGTSEPISGTIEDQTHIMVIVAPTNNNLDTNPTNPPDLTRVRAFITPAPTPGCPGVAVTYAPATWHAPMIVLGSRRVDFLVTQFANGRADDDCQEVLLGDGPDKPVLDGTIRIHRLKATDYLQIEVDLSSLQLEDRSARIRGHAKL